MASIGTGRTVMPIVKCLPPSSTHPGVCHSRGGCGWPIQPRSALIAGDAQQRTGQQSEGAARSSEKVYVGLVVRAGRYACCPFIQRRHVEHAARTSYERFGGDGKEMPTWLPDRHPTEALQHSL
jgi:hypothetical protein